jgi:hypothetical protein
MAYAGRLARALLPIPAKAQQHSQNLEDPI